MPTPIFDKNGTAKARFFEMPFECRGKARAVRRSPHKHPDSSRKHPDSSRKHPGSSLPRKRSVLGVGKLPNHIAGMPRSSDAWRSVQLMLYDLQRPDTIAPFGKLLLPDTLGHILSFTDFSVENARIALRRAQITSEIPMDLALELHRHPYTHKIDLGLHIRIGVSEATTMLGSVPTDIMPSEMFALALQFDKGNKQAQWGIS